MKKINKKAVANVGALTTAKKYSLDCASKIIGISTDDCIGFLTIRHYIQKNKTGYNATGMGVEFGYCVNDKNNNAILTQKGFDKISGAFENWNKASKETNEKIIAKFGSVENYLNLLKVAFD